MTQEVWLFVAVGKRSHEEHEVRLLFKDRFVAIYNGEFTVNDFNGTNFATMLQCHQDPMFGWEEMLCSW